MVSADSKGLNRMGLGFKAAGFKLFCEMVVLNITYMAVEGVEGNRLRTCTVGTQPRPSDQDVLRGTHVVLPWGKNVDTKKSMIGTRCQYYYDKANEEEVKVQMEGLEAVLRHDWLFQGDLDARLRQLYEMFDNMGETGFCVYGLMRDPAPLLLAPDGMGVKFRDNSGVGRTLQDMLPRWYLPRDCDLMTDELTPKLEVSAVLLLEKKKTAAKNCL
jgi:hypothetical protein